MLLAVVAVKYSEKTAREAGLRRRLLAFFGFTAAQKQPGTATENSEYCWHNTIFLPTALRLNY
jgi:hypothetical protein